jgi:hypothetical protein
MGSTTKFVPPPPWAHPFVRAKIRWGAPSPTGASFARDRNGSEFTRIIGVNHRETFADFLQSRPRAAARRGAAFMRRASICRPTAPGRKKPRAMGTSAGQAACYWPRRSRFEARDLRNVAADASLAPLANNAEQSLFRCGTRSSVEATRPRPGLRNPETHSGDLVRQWRAGVHTDGAMAGFLAGCRVDSRDRTWPGARPAGKTRPPADEGTEDPRIS